MAENSSHKPAGWRGWRLGHQQPTSPGAAGILRHPGISVPAVARWKLALWEDGTQSTHLPDTAVLPAEGGEEQQAEAAGHESEPAAVSDAGPLALSLSLPDLPTGVLESIAALLSLVDRVALMSCCRALWAHPDLVASPRLWGDLHFGRRPLCSPLPLAAWLRRHRSALRSVDIEVGGLLRSRALHFYGLLHMLCAAPGLGQLGLHVNRGFPGEAALFLQPLACLGASLTALDLSNCHLDAVPSLMELEQLQRLSLARNPALGAALERSSFIPCLPTTLTKLDLSHCGLEAVPMQLTLCKGLVELEVSFNSQLGWAAGVEYAFEPLRYLTSLTCLRASGCTALTALPSQLGATSALAELDLSLCTALGLGGEEVCKPLLQLTALKSCGLSAVPQQVSALSSLEHLRLSSNTGLWHADADAFAPLQPLAPTLTALALGSCRIQSAPSALCALTALRRLSLQNNPDLGHSQGALSQAFHPLEHLTQLTHLRIGYNTLTDIPRQVLLLTRLEVLDLGSLEPFGSSSDMANSLLLALHHLPALTCLRMASSQTPLRAVRQALAPLGAALVLSHLPLNDRWLQLGQLGSCHSRQSAAQLALDSTCVLGGKPHQVNLKQAKQAPKEPGVEHHTQRPGWHRGLGAGRRQKRSGEEAMGGSTGGSTGVFSFPGDTSAAAAGTAAGVEPSGREGQGRSSPDSIRGSSGLSTQLRGLRAPVGAEAAAPSIRDSEAAFSFSATEALSPTPFEASSPDGRARRRRVAAHRRPGTKC